MDAQVAQFVSITGGDASQAQFYLQASGGDLNTAVEMFFNGDATGTHPAPAPAPVAAPAPAPAPAPGGPRTLSGAPAPAQHTAAPATAPRAKPSAAKPAAGRVRTLSDMAKDDAGGSSDEDGEGGKGTRTYAGGTSSGLAVQNNDPREIARQVMENARAQGAKDGRQAAEEAKQAFAGAGYRLGATLDSGPARPVRGTKRNEVAVTIHMWNNGFSVDDGPLRVFADPENRQFMEELNQGRVPRELHAKAADVDAEAGGPPEFVVNLMQENRDFVEPPKPAFQAFTGSGRTMSGAAGGAAPPGHGHGHGHGGGGGAAHAHGPPAAAAAAAGSAPPVPVDFKVDPGKESTTLRIILADGTRLQSKFNVDHTIGDIRRFIDLSRPGQHRAYELITTMPREVFADNGQTIQAAGLRNATVVQHPL